MLRNIGRTVLAGLAIATTACATIVGGGTKQSVGITSEPSGASFTVKSSSGLQMAVGKTPFAIQRFIASLPSASVNPQSRTNGFSRALAIAS